MELELNVPTEVEKAWMAGFMDGEGTFFVRITNAYRGDGKWTHSPEAKVSNCVIESLYLFRSTYGGNIILQGIETETRRASHRWVCPARQLRVFIEDIIPYLRIKRIQAKLLIEFLDLGTGRNYPKGVIGTGRIPEGLWLARQEIREKMLDLNMVGPR